MASNSTRAERLLAQQFEAIYRRTDWLFVWVLALQWLGSVATMLWLSWPSWPGTESHTHFHLGAAILIGGAITSLPVCLAVIRPGAAITRQSIGLAQMAWSALLIYLSGGRIEAHFHVFGSLALLAAYRDWRVLVTATAAIGCDYFIRGHFWPQSVFGTPTAAPYRAWEYLAWVLCENTFLIITIQQSVREMAESATHRARLEETNRKLEAEFVARTAQYQQYTIHLENSQRTLEVQAGALEAQAEQLREARTQAEAASRAKSDFLASMSHEIRTPMTAVLGYADVLQGNLCDADVRQAAQTIKRNGEYLLEIVNSILDLSKIEAGCLQVERLRCSPHQVVGDVLQLMRVRAEAKGLRLSAEYKGQIPATIHTDPTRLRQILLNLVSNAVKFSTHGKVRLRVQLQRSGLPEPLLRFSVIDEGIGMTIEQREHLFQPFSQADSSMTRRFGGTGLGLSISKRLAELMGGSLDCTSSSPDRGTTFAVTVATGRLDGACLVRDHGSLMQEPFEQPATASLWGATALDCRILVADDCPDNQDLVSFVLRKAGAKVMLADHGQQAVEMALWAKQRGQPYHVVLMDMQMPVLDGYAATRCLRARGYQGAIIGLTAHAMREELDRCLAAGCDAYATKPIDRGLVDLIAEHAGRTKGDVLSSPAPGTEPVA